MVEGSRGEGEGTRESRWVESGRGEQRGGLGGKGNKRVKVGINE